jgi:hypothetical protein
MNPFDIDLIPILTALKPLDDLLDRLLARRERFIRDHLDRMRIIDNRQSPGATSTILATQVSAIG